MLSSSARARRWRARRTSTGCGVPFDCRHHGQRCRRPCPRRRTSAAGRRLVFGDDSRSEHRRGGRSSRLAARSAHRISDSPRASLRRPCPWPARPRQHDRAGSRRRRRTARRRTRAGSRQGSGALNEAHALRIPVHREGPVVVGCKVGIPASDDLAAIVLDPLKIPHVGAVHTLWSAATHTTYAATGSALRAATPIPAEALKTPASFGTPVAQRIIAAGTSALAFMRAADLLVSYLGLDNAHLRAFASSEFLDLQATILSAIAAWH